MVVGTVGGAPSESLTSDWCVDSSDSVGSVYLYLSYRLKLRSVIRLLLRQVSIFWQV